MTKVEFSTVMFRSMIPAIVMIGCGILVVQEVARATPIADEATREDRAIAGGLWIIFLVILMIFLSIIRSILLRGRERGRPMPSLRTSGILIALYAATSAALILLAMPGSDFAPDLLVGAAIVVLSWTALGCALGDADSRADRAREASRAPLRSRALPSETVPVASAEVADFVRTAVSAKGGITRSNWPIEWLNSSGGVIHVDLWIRLELTFTSVDEGHTRIDVRALNRGFWQLRFGATHRFFVALQDELDRRIPAN